MTQEDKELLLKDLCARLPYGVMIKEEYGDYINVNLYNAHLEHLIDRISDGLDKLVLRPRSSMTERDCLSLSKELNLSIKARGGDIYFTHNADNTLENWNKVNNWLLEHHFDFMGLIPKGLAIEVTESNNPYESL